MLELLNRVPTATIPHHREPNSLRRLACAVFTQALKDSGIIHYRNKSKRKKSLRQEAIRFLTHDDEAFPFWCEALNLHPEKVRTELKRRLGGASA